MKYLKQSFAWWCFARGDMTAERLVRLTAEIGYEAVELVGQEYWPLIKAHGLTIASINGQSSIEAGFNRREHHARLEQEVRDRIALAVQWGIPNLIVFSGNRAGLSDQKGAEITAEGLRRVAPLARDAGITLILELLNSKVDHPDYQADKVNWGLQVCHLVDSLAVKLLYDIYHMQIMEGDIIQTIRRHHALFAHYHTAGNPGRHEFDQTQELQYEPIFQTIAATGYQGYIGHEFLPTGDPEQALQWAFERCHLPIRQRA
ncbi:MAG TPA: TIM barrel protein [Ktedonosporobacter sp.]|nr:TIM barrel protein [Ktedonosporobacter sp.]